MAGIKINNLVKAFGNVFAVKNLSLEIKDKSFMVLLGPSGCGKTTTLRCIAGLEKPDGGEIYIDNKLVNDVLPKDRDVAMVFQNYALYPHMSVFDNLAFPLKMRKIPKDQQKEKIAQVAELLGIEHLLDRKPRQLSGGEAQRVALGRAIVRNPKVFLMDEPLSNLDAKLRLYMRSELKKLQKKLSITTIYVTHDQVEAMTMADEIAIMDHGVLKQVSAPREIYNHPKNVFVASFIGSPPMNLISCSFVEKGKTAYLDAGAFSLPISDELRGIVKEKMTNTELFMGIRPEDILVKKEKGIKGEVDVIEPLGAEFVVHLCVGEQILLAMLPKSAGFTDISPGDIVFIEFNLNNLHIFDKKTGETII
ncbi:TPA: ABC transporter ATP-binding protein [Candidatus Poribacteria bacterium]|nr:ABC transporter ATP-binding protein [Candidatus Poribacteria bacterium]